MRKRIERRIERLSSTSSTLAGGTSPSPPHRPALSRVAHMEATPDAKKQRLESPADSVAAGAAVPSAAAASSSSHPDHGYLVGGQRAADLIASALATSAPRQFIESFQRDYSLDDQLPALRDASTVLPLFDLLRVPRADVFYSLLTALRVKLLEELPTQQEALLQMLEKTFPYIGFDELRAVPVAIMQRLSRVPVSYLKQLALNKDLCKSCGIDIQRQVWEANEPLFRQEVFPLINDYIAHYAHAQSSGGAAAGGDWATKRAPAEPEAPRTRREKNTSLQSLVKLVGKSVALYRMLTHSIRTLFLSTGNVAFCSLRSEFGLALHDSGLPELYDTDKVDKFASLLVAAVREKKPNDLSRYEAIMAELEQLSSAASQSATSLLAFVDATLFCADPHTEGQLLRLLYSQLNDILDRQAIPKDDLTLRHLSTLLLMAQLARERSPPISTTRPTPVPLPSKELLGQFYPQLLSHLLETRIHSMSGEEGAPPPRFAGMGDILKKPGLPRLVTLYHIIQRIEEDDVTIAKSLSEVISSSGALGSSPLLTENTFLHSLISACLRTKQPEIRTVVIDVLIRNAEQHLFLQKQLLRFFTVGFKLYSHSSLVQHVQDLIAQSAKLVARFGPENPTDAKEKERLTAMYSLLFDRISGRVAADQSVFLQEYLRKHGLLTAVKAPAPASAASGAQPSVGAHAPSLSAAVLAGAAPSHSSSPSSSSGPASPMPSTPAGPLN